VVQKLGLVNGVHNYAYDAENRISTVDGGSTASYTYDAEGRRIAKEAATYYIYDLSGHVMSEYGDCQTCLSTDYIYLNGGLTAIYANSTTYFVHPDHLGSTRLMTAYPTPSVYNCNDYYPFGELIACGSTGGTTHKFTGQERDTESNLDNFQARYTSSTLGRFMSPDPANAGAESTNPQSWNMYSYAVNSPLVLTDPTGLGPCDEDNDDPTCEPGTGNGFGYGTYPQQNGQNPPPPSSTALDPGCKPPGCILSIVTLHLGFCETSNAGCAHELERIVYDLRWNKAFAKSLFSWQSFGAGQIHAQNAGYYGCIGNEMIPFKGLLAAAGAKVAEEGASQAAEHGGSLLAGAYYHFTDGRFTAWGSSSKVLVPNAAAKIATVAKVASVVGWALTDAELAKAINSCSEKL
jgi:RHS repeat-associated protein